LMIVGVGRLGEAAHLFHIVISVHSLNRPAPHTLRRSSSWQRSTLAMFINTTLTINRLEPNAAFQGHFSARKLRLKVTTHDVVAFQASQDNKTFGVSVGYTTNHD
jgi:hypothetical protein